MRDLREQGGVNALAFNDPQRLQEALRDTTTETTAGRGWDNND